ncbi:tetratricopeptide repeat protein [Streptomyces lancefieldiae]|uniref:Tetratricopeptide repeat protein n=1 Tax=Streptomyces lancefieldiae TaxID=3075520 RepID=A0ABU3B221_9ACTN|nr:tetratricopeptide repeat protein [Streptomyces sp. DSM 40712]MDT0616482.1 tetratricopeptide repeat protein [Streptomyces sp. DSM 40712]
MSQHEEAINLFRKELDQLLRASKATLGELSRLASSGGHPVSTTTISAWRHGVQVPNKDAHRVFLAIVEAAGRKIAPGSAYTPRPMAWWDKLVTRLREERSKNKGGRPRSTAKAGATGVVVLPPRPERFTGRSDQLAEVMRHLEPAVDADAEVAAVSTVVGMASVGKTALALEAAHQAVARGWFPGGALFADLGGHTPNHHTDISTVVVDFLQALGVKDKDMPVGQDGRIRLWRTLLHDRATAHQPVLIVLDNALDAGPVKHLRPDPPHRMLVTSRYTLSALSAPRLALKPFTQQEAVTLLDTELRVSHPADTRVEIQEESAAELAGLCGYLPLALHIIIALLRDDPDRSLAEQAAALKDARNRLDLLEYSDNTDEHGRPLAVRAAFELSYQRLKDDEARTFRLLSCAPGADISMTSAHVLLGTEGAQRTLAVLLRAHLVEKRPKNRWAMHDLVRLYSGELGAQHADDDHREASLDRLLSYYTIMAEGAVPPDHDPFVLVRPFADAAAATKWLDEEEEVLLASALSPEARNRQHPARFAIALALSPYLSDRRKYQELLVLSQTALDVLTKELHIAARTMNPRKRVEIAHIASILVNLSIAQGALGQYDHALASVGKAIQLTTRSVSTAAVDQEGRRYTTMLYNLAGLLIEAGRSEEAKEVTNVAINTAWLLKDMRSAAFSGRMAGLAHRDLGELDDAREYLQVARAAFQTLGEVRAEAHTVSDLGVVYRLAEMFEEALAAFMECDELARAVGSRFLEAENLINIGLSHRDLGNLQKATEAFDRAIAIAQEVGSADIEETALLGRITVTGS